MGRFNRLPFLKKIMKVKITKICCDSVTKKDLLVGEIINLPKARAMAAIKNGLAVSAEPKKEKKVLNPKTEKK